MRRLAICLIVLSLASISAVADDSDKGTFGLALMLERGGTGRNSVKVMHVAPNTAAARAGMRGGDVIMALGGKPIGFADDAQLRAYFRGTKPGDRVRMMVLRDGRLRLVTMVAEAVRVRPVSD